METQSESNGATVGGGGSEQYQVSGSYFHYTHWYHVINNKHIVQMYGWRVEVIHMSILDMPTKIYMMIPLPLAIVIKHFKIGMRLSYGMHAISYSLCGYQLDGLCA